MFVYRARTVFEHQNGQLQDDKEQFAEFDKKCIRLVSWTVPLSDYYNPTTDFLHFMTLTNLPVSKLEPVVVMLHCMLEAVTDTE